MKKQFIPYLSAIILLATCLAVHPASAIPQRPDPPRLVNDLAGIFSSRQTSELENVLVAFDDSTSNQIAVVTASDLEGYTPAEYATRIGIDWQVGSSKFDNGIVILVKPKTARSSGEVFIAVGYGLEGAIPDAYAKRVIENIMIPAFREGDYFSGVEGACNILMKLASGEISDPREIEEDESLWAVFSIFVIIFFGIFIVILAFENGNNGKGGNGGNGGFGGRRTIYVGPIITSGRNYGGSSFGGGFGGGFGGFGGGSFGGGGAGGSW